MRTRVIAAFALCLAIAAPARAQLLVTSRVQVETTTNDRHFPALRLFTQLFAGVAPETRRATFETRTIIGPDAVRIEGLGPLRGFPSQFVMIGRRDGSLFWLDPTTRTYYELSADELTIFASLHQPIVKTEQQGEATLLGRRTRRQRDESTVKFPSDPERSRAATDDMGRRRLTEPLPIAGGKLTSLEPEIAQLWMNEASQIRDIQIVSQSWIASEFADAGKLAATAGAFSIMSRVFGLPAPAGLPLRQIVQLRASNGEGYRVETNVVSVTKGTLSDSLFDVPTWYVRGEYPLLLVRR